MEMASCIDISTGNDPKTDCVCQLGRVMSKNNDACVIPPPTTPTPRPDPTLPPDVKVAATAVWHSYNKFLLNSYQYFSPHSIYI